MVKLKSTFKIENTVFATKFRKDLTEPFKFSVLYTIDVRIKFKFIFIYGRMKSFLIYQIRNKYIFSLFNNLTVRNISSILSYSLVLNAIFM